MNGFDCALNCCDLLLGSISWYSLLLLVGLGNAGGTVCAT